MSLDLRFRQQMLMDTSHAGMPVIVEQIQTGNRGHPAIHIDPEFLCWAYSMHSTTSIAEFLGVSRGVVRAALLQYGIAEPQQNPFLWIPEVEGEGGNNGQTGSEISMQFSFCHHKAFAYFQHQ